MYFIREVASHLAEKIYAALKRIGNCVSSANLIHAALLAAPAELSTITGVSNHWISGVEP